MGFFGDLIKIAAPIAGGVFFGPAGAAIGAGIAGKIGADDQARAAQRAGAAAGQTSMGAFNYLTGSPIGTQYLPAGGNAAQMQAALLGAGGDPAAAQAAYENYLNSIGYQGQLEAGSRAITSNRAAAGLLGSGSTGRALTRYGQQLGRESFGNYLAQLGGVAGMGLQAGGLLGQTAAGAYGDAARYQYGGDMGAADARAGGWDQLLGGLGSAYDIWQAGRGGPAALPGTPSGIQNTIQPAGPIRMRPALPMPRNNVWGTGGYAY